MATYPALEEIVWVQEEPENMGAWRALSSELREIAGEGLRVRRISRPAAASPAEGNAGAAALAQARLVEESLAAL